jgi:hypothetical protein
MQGTVNLYEQIKFAPANHGAVDTGGLFGILSITATSEASGVGNADGSVAITAISKSMTVNDVVVAAGDPRVTFNRCGARMVTNPSAIGAGATLHLRAYIDSQDTSHMLFDVTYSATGAQYNVNDLIAYGTVGNGAGNLSTAAFASLLDGGAHTLYFFFWCSGGTPTATITAASTDLVYAIGTTVEPATANEQEFCQIAFTGHISGLAVLTIATATTDTANMKIYNNTTFSLNISTYLTSGTGGASNGGYLALLLNLTQIYDYLSLKGYASGANDLCYFSGFNYVLNV